jgi:hypothetical protein
VRAKYIQYSRLLPHNRFLLRADALPVFPDGGRNEPAAAKAGFDQVESFSLPSPAA